MRADGQRLQGFKNEIMHVLILRFDSHFQKSNRASDLLKIAYLRSITNETRQIVHNRVTQDAVQPVWIDRKIRNRALEPLNEIVACDVRRRRHAAVILFAASGRCNRQLTLTGGDFTNYPSPAESLGGKLADRLVGLACGAIPSWSLLTANYSADGHPQGWGRKLEV